MGRGSRGAPRLPDPLALTRTLSSFTVIAHLPRDGTRVGGKDFLLHVRTSPGPGGTPGDR